MRAHNVKPIELTEHELLKLGKIMDTTKDRVWHGSPKSVIWNECERLTAESNILRAALQKIALGDDVEAATARRALEDASDAYFARTKGGDQ